MIIKVIDYFYKFLFWSLSIVLICFTHRIFLSHPLSIILICSSHGVPLFIKWIWIFSSIRASLSWPLFLYIIARRVWKNTNSLFYKFLSCLFWNCLFWNNCLFLSSLFWSILFWSIWFFLSKYWKYSFEKVCFLSTLLVNVFWTHYFFHNREWVGKSQGRRKKTSL